MTVQKHRCYTSLAVVLLLAGLSVAAPTYYTDLASFDAASQTTLVEDFEDVTPYEKDKAYDSITLNGITYVGEAGTNVWVAAPGYENFGVQPETTTSVLTATGPEDFSVNFVLPGSCTALAFDTYLNGDGPATIQVYGADGLLGTYELLHPATEIGFFGVTSNDPITKVRWTTTGGEVTNTGIDNVRVGCVVPAPGALLLGSLGTACLGWLRRRRTI